MTANTMDMTPHAAGEDEKSGRRSFITSATAGTLAVYAAATGGLSILFMRPRVTYGPPFRVPIGKMADYVAGSQTVMAEAKMVIRRVGNRIAAISTVCTHLGCTVNPVDTGFDCPCHGSTYDDQGEVTGGPAPAPLAWYRVSQLPSGELIVDKHDEVPADTFLEVQS
jgi:cytochrome b6-f complex iron-sulfur subunit